MFHAATIVLDNRPMLMSATLDWARLTAFLGHLTAGFKNCDPRCVNPITGFNITNFQSRNECYVCVMTFCKECKEAYESGVIKEFLDYMLYRKNTDIKFVFCQREACVIGKKDSPGRFAPKGLISYQQFGGG